MSFLRENPSASPKSIERQKHTRAWWQHHRQKFELVTAQYVLDEARTGHPELAAERLRHLNGIPLLPLSRDVDRLATETIHRVILPASAVIDALHIACAAVNRIDLLLTWNCKHIANPVILPRVFRTLDDFGLPFPVICTPKDLLDEDDDETLG